MKFATPKKTPAIDTRRSVIIVRPRLAHLRGVTLQKWEQLAPVAQFHAGQLSTLAHVSARQLCRQFRKEFNCTPQEWLDEFRLNLACERLMSGQGVKAIALDLGFKQVSHFCRRFKQRYGMTATEFLLHHIKAAPHCLGTKTSFLDNKTSSADNAPLLPPRE